VLLQGVDEAEKTRKRDGERAEREIERELIYREKERQMEHKKT